MKTIFKFVITILLSTTFMSCANAQSVQDIIELVNYTSKQIEISAYKTFTKINQGQHPYRSAKNKSLYVFVFDTKQNIIAHGAMPDRVGKNIKGITDNLGKPYNDIMLKKALKYQNDWTEYNYIDPKTNKISLKKTYFELVKGDNGVKYIVGSGLYYDN